MSEQTVEACMKELVGALHSFVVICAVGSERQQSQARMTAHEALDAWMDVAKNGVKAGGA